MSEFGRQRASDVTWLDGRMIPPLWSNYLSEMHMTARKILGEHVFRIMDDESTTKEEKMSKVKDAFELAKSIVRNAEQMIVRVGMKVEDFPIIATDKK